MLDRSTTTTDILGHARALPGVLANSHDQYDLLRAVQRVDAYCAELAAIRSIHAQNLCRVANHLQAGELAEWGHKTSLKHAFNVWIHAIEDLVEEGKARHTPPHLLVGSTVTVDVEDEDDTFVVRAAVDVSEENAPTGPEILAGLALDAKGWVLAGGGPEWSPDQDGIFTTGVAWPTSDAAQQVS